MKDKKISGEVKAGEAEVNTYSTLLDKYMALFAENQRLNRVIENMKREYSGPVEVLTVDEIINKYGDLLSDAEIQELKKLK